MFKQMAVTGAVLLVLGFCPAANAQQFIYNTPPALAQQSAMIEQSFSNFDRNLDNQSEVMQRDRDQSAMAAAQINYTNQMSNFDTENSAEQQFQNGQEQMLAGGGAYNSQGFIWGAPWMGMGYGYQGH